jgi:DNA-directed RNA polymerase subunit F
MQLVLITDESQKKRFGLNKEVIAMDWNCDVSDLKYLKDITRLRLFDPLGVKNNIPPILSELPDIKSLSIPSHLLYEWIENDHLNNLEWLGIDKMDKVKKISIPSCYEKKTLKTLSVDEGLVFNFKQNNFPNLEFLDLPLRNQEQIEALVRFSSLKCLRVSKISSFAEIKNLLESLKINDLTIKASPLKALEKINLPYLEKVSFIDMSNLENIYDFFVELKEIKELKISYCKKIIDLNVVKNSFPNLTIRIS